MANRKMFVHDTRMKATTEVGFMMTGSDVLRKKIKSGLSQIQILACISQEAFIYYDILFISKMKILTITTIQLKRVSLPFLAYPFKCC